MDARCRQAVLHNALKLPDLHVYSLSAADHDSEQHQISSCELQLPWRRSQRGSATLAVGGAATLRLKRQDPYIAALQRIWQRGCRHEGSYSQARSCGRHSTHLSYPVTFGAVRLCILHKVRVLQVQPKVGEPCPLLHHVSFLLLSFHFQCPGEAPEALRPGPSDGIWQCSSQILLMKCYSMS